MNKKIILPLRVLAPIPTHILFRLDAKLYGLPLSQVAGVSLTDQAPFHNTHFQSVDRIDLRALLRLPGRETGGETGLILLSSYNLGFHVDLIEDIVFLDTRFQGQTGTVSFKNQTITLLDIHTLLYPEVLEFA